MISKNQVGYSVVITVTLARGKEAQTMVMAVEMIESVGIPEIY